MTVWGKGRIRGMTQTLLIIHGIWRICSHLAPSPSITLFFSKQVQPTYFPFPLVQTPWQKGVLGYYTSAQKHILYRLLRRATHTILIPTLICVSYQAQVNTTLLKPRLWGSEGLNISTPLKQAQQRKKLMNPGKQIASKLATVSKRQAASSLAKLCSKNVDVAAITYSSLMATSLQELPSKLVRHWPCLLPLWIIQYGLVPPPSNTPGREGHQRVPKRKYSW